MLAALGGCGKGRYVGALPANQRPELELTQAPASTSEPYFYAYELRWAGFDADGVVDHYLYCVDPPTVTGVDTPWVATTENRRTFLFRANQVDSAGARTGHAYHTIVLKAVDDGGLASAPVHRSFDAYTITPTVEILSPIPNKLFTPTFGSGFRILWQGDDPDGRTSRTPLQYKWKVFEDGGEIPLLTVLLQPDTLRRRYGPNFAGWDSVPGTVTSLDLRDLTEGLKLAVLVAFDEAGAFSPVFSLDDNMLLFNVSYSSARGPVLTLSNEFLYYKYEKATYSLDPTTFIRAEFPADTPLNFYWSGAVHAGTFVSGYRWKLDGDVADQTPRANEATDVSRWSRWSPLTTSCTVPAIVPPAGQFSETHFFYLEARDNEGQTSLAVVQFDAIRPRFDKRLLIVDDTRYKLDSRLASGALAPPSGAWPTAAELDTFLYAVGGRPWTGYPAGTLSPPGLFAGYDFDTLGTRYQPGGLVTLGQLGRYREIVWLVDGKSATNLNPVDYPRDPMPFLHHVSYPGRSNPLTVWVKQGGKAWLMGGGIATCMQREWEKYGTSSLVFSYADSELVQGRFMFDLAHWRSEITIGLGRQAGRSTAGQRPWPGMPDYGALPALLSEKTAATDPIATYAPNRTNQSDYYQSVFTAEVLTRANTITEDVDPGVGENLQPALDTLYATNGGAVGSGKPMMTLYHGSEHAPLVFSGFPLWYFKRSQAIPVADFVLERFWGLPRRPVAR